MRNRFVIAAASVFCVGLVMAVLLADDVYIEAPRPGDAGWRPQPASKSDDGKLRIIVFGAHPDDSEIQAGGVGALWASQGHQVKFVSLTNGDIGHWRMAGGPLAQRRITEVRKAAEVLGIAETEVLDIHDGELMPTLETRRTVVRLIREWQADIVVVHRLNDYHPDHRNAGLVVRDAAYMVTVPYFCPDVPYLETNPVFLFSYDRFTRPYPFVADVVIDIDPVVETKVNALAVMESQFVEGGCCSRHIDPQTDAERAAGRGQARERFRNRFANIANQYRERLVAIYGTEKAAEVKHAEAFEIAEHGRRPTDEELARLFPFPGVFGN